jgi:hypothetical protein
MIYILLMYLNATDFTHESAKRAISLMLYCRHSFSQEITDRLPTACATGHTSNEKNAKFI